MRHVVQCRYALGANRATRLYAVKVVAAQRLISVYSKYPGRGFRFHNAISIVDKLSAYFDIFDVLIKRYIASRIEPLNKRVIPKDGATKKKHAQYAKRGAQVLRAPTLPRKVGEGFAHGAFPCNHHSLESAL
jgi:hypothetical protein